MRPIRAVPAALAPPVTLGDVLLLEAAIDALLLRLDMQPGLSAYRLSLATASLETGFWRLRETLRLQH